MAVVCLICVAPMMSLVAFLVLITSGRPVFYSGKRLGLNKTPFHILKFRTLHHEAANKTNGKVLAKRTLLETRLGSYLRSSRLDELPQLFNILKGEMVFFGPRPIRPEMLPVFERDVTDLSVRFDVRPGLVGMAQAFLPHAASKRLRGRYAAMYCRADTNYIYVLGILSRVGLIVLRRGTVALISAVLDRRSPFRRFNFLRAGFATPKHTTVQFNLDGTETAAGLLGISDQVLQFATARPVATGEIELAISRKLASGRQLRIDLVAVVESVWPLGPQQAGFVVYATYQPKSSYQLYRIERYLLGDCVLPA